VEADAIEAEFREMVLGYERVVSGAEIPSYIKELERLMRDWQLFQGDYCYVDVGGGC